MSNENKDRINYKTKAGKKIIESVTIDGKTQPLRDWERLSGVSSGTIRARLYKGITPREAVFGKAQGTKNIMGSGIDTHVMRIAYGAWR